VDGPGCLSYAISDKARLFKFELPGFFCLSPLCVTASLMLPLSRRSHMKLIQAQSRAEITNARMLFEEYAAGLGLSLCFQNFDRELAELPGRYAPPSGRLLLAFVDNELAGCVALRKIDEGVCEMKRLFVRQNFRGRSLGRNLAAAIIDSAREIGYRQIRLDTLPDKMEPAVGLYRRLGFKEIEPYYSNPVPGATFMELSL
jgi:ribosomal protein S18 acetylase RimI-like enzyme